MSCNIPPPPIKNMNSFSIPLNHSTFLCSTASSRAFDSHARTRVLRHTSEHECVPPSSDVSDCCPTLDGSPPLPSPHPAGGGGGEHISCYPYFWFGFLPSTAFSTLGKVGSWERLTLVISYVSACCILFSVYFLVCFYLFFP